MRYSQQLFKYSRKRFVSLIFLVLFVAVAPYALFAQGEVSLWGSVSDSSGAAVAGAAVTVINLETGSSRSLVTDEAGRYNANALSVGHYEVTAAKAGFQSDRRANIALVVGQREEVDLTLQVGDVHQTVEVPADLGAIQITTEDISGLVGERQVKDLPLNGRSYDQLLTLNPGIVNYTSQRAGGIGTSNSVVGNMFAVSGRRPQ